MKIVNKTSVKFFFALLFAILYIYNRIILIFFWELLDVVIDYAM